MLVICNHCGGRVLPKPESVCPSCNKTIDAPLSASEGQGLRAERAAVASGPPRWSFRAMVERRSKVGILLGVALTAWGLFGGSYRHRGAGQFLSGMDLAQVGIGITVFATLVYLLCRTKKAG